MTSKQGLHQLISAKGNAEMPTWQRGHGQSSVRGQSSVHGQSCVRGQSSVRGQSCVRGQSSVHGQSSVRGQPAPDIFCQSHFSHTNRLGVKGGVSVRLWCENCAGWRGACVLR